MEEMFKLMILLGLAVVGNILGGIFTNIQIENYEFDLHLFLRGIAKALCVTFMCLSLSYILQEIPNLQETLGVEPKAMIISAIGIYVAKTCGHLTHILNIGQHDVNYAKPPIEEELEEYIDM